MSLKIECQLKWNVNQNRISLKWNVTQIGKSLKMECKKEALKMACH